MSISYIELREWLETLDDERLSDPVELFDEKSGKWVTVSDLREIDGDILLKGHLHMIINEDKHEWRERNTQKMIGLYWYCAENYEGMGDWRYRVLSTSPYRPSSLATLKSDLEYYPDAKQYFDKLVSQFEGEGQ